jgi:hypothetical protein
MNSKHFYLRLVIAIGCLTIGCVVLFFNSCKDKEGESVTFNLSPLAVTFINDTNVDSLNAVDSFYVDTIAVSNDYYRTALEDNNVYADDVEKVSITGCAIEAVGNPGFDFSNYKSITLVLQQPGYAPQLLIAKAISLTSGNAVSFTLESSSNLLTYFKLLNMPMFVFIGKNNAVVPQTELKVTLNFAVTGVDH